MRVIIETNAGTIAATYTGGNYISIHSTPDDEAISDLIRVWDYEEHLSVLKLTPRELALTVQDWLRDTDPSVKVSRVIVETVLLPVDQSDLGDFPQMD